MCGIAGLFDSAGMEADAARMQTSLELMHRRGPDSSGTWHDGHAHFGHRRLAIVDLSPAGHQPMKSADDRYVITFNGEIYNHAALRAELDPPGGWRGTSDTETLLAAYARWGADCLSRLNGMFAFAIWDRHERRLFAARDRLGVKPLYYAEQGTRLAFASRPGALRALDARFDSGLDPEAIRNYLELGFIPAPLAPYRGMRKLPGAHYLVADASGSRVVRYWDYRHIVPDAAWNRRTESDLLDELDALMRDAVKLRLMSDVPLGAFLSGGVDSALVVAIMARVGHSPPQTFTIGFDEPAFDESATSAQIARHLHVEQTVETLSVRDLLTMLPRFVEEYDEPFADASAFPTLAVARLAGRHVRVALTGDGGDEAFGGYHYYGLMEKLAAMDQLPATARRWVVGAIGRLPGHRFKLLSGALRPASAAGRFHFMRGVGKDYGSLLSPDFAASTQDSESLFAQCAASFAMDLQPAEVGMRLDTAFVLPNLFLQKVDVATMSWSVEARCPFVDYRVVEWANRLPLKHKLAGGVPKSLLKKLLCRYLPHDYVYRRKRGFGVPVAEWLRGPLRGWSEELLHDPRVCEELPLDRARLRALLATHVSGARDHHPILWAALMLVCFVARHRGGTLPDVPNALERAA